MRSRRYSRNSGRAGLPRRCEASLRGRLLKGAFFFSFCLCLGCSSSTSPTFNHENIPQAIEDISRKEGGFEVKSALVGRTLWVYLPLENLVSRSDKPEKTVKRFEVTGSQAQFDADTLKVSYDIKKIPEEHGLQEGVKYNKDASKKIYSLLGTERRVLFSARKHADFPLFLCTVIVDIKNGLRISELSFIEDLKKVSYGFISYTEYEHRMVQDIQILPEAIADKEGKHISFKDVTMRDFLAGQIANRIRIKFQKPEAKKDADVDKECLKITGLVLNIYGFKDFSQAEISNMATLKRFLMSPEAIISRSND